MAIKIASNKFKCPYCDFTAPTFQVVDEHRDKAHDILYIPMERADVDRLIKFIFFKDENLIRPEMLKVLQVALKKSIVRDFTEDK
jgi:hypothetical protein